jgi:hypothetical protein
MSESTYMPEVLLVKLKTGGKTVEEYREKFKGQGFTYKNFEAMVKMDNYFDGLELWVSLWNYDNHENYHIWNWKPEDDEKVMLAIYQAEQFHPYPRYKNDFEQFCKVWKSGEYDPGCSFTFEKGMVEVIEIVQEEVNNIGEEISRKAKAEQRQRKGNYRPTKKKFNYKKRSR